MKSVRRHSLFLIVLSALFFVVTPLAFAQYQPLTGLPGVTAGNNSLVEYVNALFLVSISLGAMLAVIKIALAGFSYMMSDVVTTKGQAKDEIQGALLGLAILLATVTVLYVINPNLVSLNILGNAKPVSIAPMETSGTANGPATTCKDGTITITLANGQTSTGCADYTPPSNFQPIAGIEWRPITQDAFYNQMVARCGSLCANYRFISQYPSSYELTSTDPVSGASWRDMMDTLRVKCAGKVAEEINDTLKVARFYCYTKI